MPAPLPHRQRVLKPKTAAELIAILQQVPMLDATLAAQPWGEIPGYSVAAKTGTAQVGKCQCRYGSSYIGMAPASDPQVVALLESEAPVVCLVAKSDVRHVTEALRTTYEENLLMVSDTVALLVAEVT